jgi:hypothetical protein
MTRTYFEHNAGADDASKDLIEWVPPDVPKPNTPAPRAAEWAVCARCKSPWHHVSDCEQ